MTDFARLGRAHDRAERKKMDRYYGDRVAPQEEKWCEWCGHSPEFCTCFDDLKFEEEREET